METSTATALPERPPLPDVAPDAGAIEVAAGGQPVLARIADLAQTRDRLAAQLVVALATAQTGDLAVSATRLSWAQARQVCAAARAVSVAGRGELDVIIAGALDEYRSYHPDEPVGRVWQIADGWQPSRLERLEQAAEGDEFVTVQPNFEGGGSLYGQFGPESFAVIGEALYAPLGPPVARPDVDDEGEVERALDELDARRQRGADLRVLVVDDHGHAIGVGHTTKVPPGWLRETVWVQHLTDQAPGNHTVVRRCDLDHIEAWPDGPTDVTNLQPIGRTPHTAKTKKRATVTRTGDGTTTWTNHRTALTTRRPAAWRPLDHRPHGVGRPRLPIESYDDLHPPDG